MDWGDDGGRAVARETRYTHSRALRACSLIAWEAPLFGGLEKYSNRSFLRLKGDLDGAVQTRKQRVEFLFGVGANRGLKATLRSVSRTQTVE